MKVSEIKAELDLRGISYEGLFEKAELARALAQSRSQGRADPEILNQFNRQKNGEDDGGEQREWSWPRTRRHGGGCRGGWRLAGRNVSRKINSAHVRPRDDGAARQPAHAGSHEGGDGAGGVRARPEQAE